MYYEPMGRFFKVSALADEKGNVPKEDENPPIGRRLTKVIGSAPFPPKKEEKAPPDPPPADR
jgi:hypothetical protein